MPLWIPILVMILAAAFIVIGDGGSPGTPGFLVTVLAWVTMTAAVGVVGLRWRGTPPPVWAQWLLLVGPTVVAVAATAFASIGGTPQQSAAVATCRRCGSRLLADHTGHRFYGLNGYLCPQPLQQPGDRRHHVDLPHPVGHAQQPADTPG